MPRGNFGGGAGRGGAELKIFGAGAGRGGACIPAAHRHRFQQISYLENQEKVVSPIFESDHLDLVTLKRGIAISVPVNSMTVDNHLREWFQNKHKI